MFVCMSCSDENQAEINGIYQRNMVFNSTEYAVQLTFTTDGILEWKPLSVIPGHTASTVHYVLISGKQFKVFDDTACLSEATYNFVISDKTLDINAEVESCLPREEAISGIWNKQ